MALKMLNAVVASMMFAALVSLGTACVYDKCPDHYTPVPVPFSECGYACATAWKPECLPQSTYDYRTRKWKPARAPTALELEAARPRLCGGANLFYDPIPCPAVACAYSASYAISGPLGCATAASYISTLAVSSSTYQFDEYFATALNQYVGTLCTDGYDPNTLSAYAVAAAEAYATAVAFTLSHYNTYVCTCCFDNNLALTTVSGAVQAVATAVAEAIAHAEAAVKDCNGNLLSAAIGNSEQSLAIDTQLAIDTIYGGDISINGLFCGGNRETQVKIAVAKATACAFAAAFASAANSNDPGNTFTCASTLALSGSDATWSATCSKWFGC